jgi:hypothetical protein
VLIAPSVKKTLSVAVYVTSLYLALYVFYAASARADDGSRDPLQQTPLVEKILRQSATSNAPGARITSISSHFLGTPYMANSLIGGTAEAERLVTRLDGFDCFTFLDTVEALRRSTDAADFPMQMMQVRYRDGMVSYENRRHFFSDWVSDQGSPVKDVTAIVGQGRERHVLKQLNAKQAGDLWLDGVNVVPRIITYIPASELNAKLLDALESGDYVGLYSPLAGLDVSHTGLIVEADGAIMLRHASSRGGVERILDEELVTYLRGTTGLIVYRVMQ